MSHAVHIWDLCLTICSVRQPYWKWQDRGTASSKMWSFHAQCTQQFRKHRQVICVCMFKHCICSKLIAVPSRLSMALQTLTYSIWFAKLMLCPLNSLSCQAQTPFQCHNRWVTVLLSQKRSNVQVGWHLKHIMPRMEGLACNRTARTSVVVVAIMKYSIGHCCCSWVVQCWRGVLPWQ